MKFKFARILALSLGLLAWAAHASEPEPGPPPGGPPSIETQARELVAREVRRLMQDLDETPLVRFFSGPKLVHGINFAGTFRQAWLVCVLLPGEGRTPRLSSKPRLRPYLLRERGGELQLINTVNWAESDLKC